MRRQWRNVENIQSEKATMGRACTPKQVSILTWFILALTIVALRPTPSAFAQEPGDAAPAEEVVADSNKALPAPKKWYEEPTKNLFTLALGGAIWPSLGNKEFGTTSATASHPGHVSSAGFAVETAYHRHIAHWERGDLYLGGEFGAFIFHNKGSGDTIQPSMSPIT